VSVGVGVGVETNDCKGECIGMLTIAALDVGVAFRPSLDVCLGRPLESNCSVFGMMSSRRECGSCCRC
jgi:hypothetical protein